MMDNVERGVLLETLARAESEIQQYVETIVMLTNELRGLCDALEEMCDALEDPRTAILKKRVLAIKAALRKLEPHG